ncbi:hypothetical protein ACJMK2_029968 [Sinanodonta woodiana]|uniref:Uncharacterized protein n=1 Tax=Sinanodonta woodiana TaxID=1069815 RepID=A0ABD3XFG1_SINWO
MNKLKNDYKVFLSKVAKEFLPQLDFLSKYADVVSILAKYESAVENIYIAKTSTKWINLNSLHPKIAKYISVVRGSA